MNITEKRFISLIVLNLILTLTIVIGIGFLVYKNIRRVGPMEEGLRGKIPSSYNEKNTDNNEAQ
ncbi:hypothetical protein CLPU_28c00060 [Gottschalkia purinilytica]|uniref:Uncharacterized protein n=1 Tax=Gottschalkia purinilytica TaxID=1503 RepID=A0A0L0W6A7_GOTPU|nr:hypothetical protein [Gottschalkia purinilytica]KNF07054.1 hypothetical protein CLPU_28c00060 [Gottschalkia purinilytica]